MYKFISHNETETKKIAYKLASKLHTGDILVLSGDLGAGKTKFTQGLLSFWKIENEVSSPTFTIVNEHKKEHINIYHLDVYRLSNIDEFYSIGGTEYFINSICIIEWGELLENILPNNYIKIEFEKDINNDNIRYITFRAYGDRLQKIIKELDDDNISNFYF